MSDKKFRAWHKKEKCWHYFTLPMLVECEKPIQYEIVYKNWCQWTGRWDSKCTEEYPEGQEIYERDRIKTERKDWTSSTPDSEVYFDCEGAHIVIGDSVILLQNLPGIEVIGNTMKIEKGDK